MKLRHKLPLPVLGTHEIIKIKPEYIYNIQFDLLVVDLRSAPDAEKIRVPGSINLYPGIDLEGLRSNLFSGYLTDKIVLYDNKGDLEDSHLKRIIEFLKIFDGLKEILVLEGGFQTFLGEFPFCCFGHEKYELNKIYPSQILPHLYLGAEICSIDLSVLRNLNIRKIINVTTNIRNIFESNDEYKIQYLRIPLEDSFDSQIGVYFQKCIEFINSAKDENCSILIHCQAGISRSPTIALAYIMQSMDMSLDDSLSFVREHRPIVRPNLYFMSQLLIFEERLENAKHS